MYSDIVVVENADKTKLARGDASDSGSSLYNKHLSDNDQAFVCNINLIILLCNLLYYHFA